MARFLNLLRTRQLLQILTSPAPARRTYISDMRRSAFRENLLRVLRAEIAYASADLPPSSPQTLASFAVDGRPGEQWFRLTRAHPPNETVRIDATMVDGAAPASRSSAAPDAPLRPHISLLIEVSKGGASGLSLQFTCSAWPDALDVEKVFPVRKGEKAVEPFLGPHFGELDGELQKALREYLEERGVNDELAEYLHTYVEGKERGEIVRWLRNVESHIKQ